MSYAHRCRHCAFESSESTAVTRWITYCDGCGKLVDDDGDVKEPTIRIVVEGTGALPSGAILFVGPPRPQPASQYTLCVPCATARGIVRYVAPERARGEGGA